MAELNADIARIDQRCSDIERRLSSLENTIKRIESLTVAVEKLALSVENMAKDQLDYRTKQNEIANRLLEVEQLPMKEKAKHHDKVIEKIIGLILAGVVGFLLNHFLGL